MKSLSLSFCSLLTASLFFSHLSHSFSQDLQEIKNQGVLRHISIPYANFNSGAGDGLDVELVRNFADSLGVKYEYVGSSWASVIPDLTGKKVKPTGSEIEVLGDAPIKGDIIANGFTQLPWREKIVDYSAPTFPTQVWLIARADSPLHPISPTGSIADDIAATRKLIDGSSVMGKAGTCLDLSLYDFASAGAMGINFEGTLNELAPALLSNESDLLILDVPDALVALNKWPGKLKVLGPMSPEQTMGSAFRKTSPNLQKAFDSFLTDSKQNGLFLSLVKKYYPDVFIYYPEFFKGIQ